MKKIILGVGFGLFVQNASAQPIIKVYQDELILKSKISASPVEGGSLVHKEEYRGKSLSLFGSHISSFVEDAAMLSGDTMAFDTSVASGFSADSPYYVSLWSNAQFIWPSMESYALEINGYPSIETTAILSWCFSVSGEGSYFDWASLSGAAGTAKLKLTDLTSDKVVFDLSLSKLVGNNGFGSDNYFDRLLLDGHKYHLEAVTSDKDGDDGYNRVLFGIGGNPTLIAVPAPATLALMLAGIAVMFSRNRDQSKVS